MASLYEINQELYSLVDWETGEVADQERFEELQLEKDKKIEGIACWIKNLRSDVKELKEEEGNLNARRKSKENLIERLESLLANELDGAQFETAKAKITWRKSTAVNITDETLIPAEFKVEKVTVSVDKKALGDALKFGEVIDGAELVQNNNIQIK